MNKAEKMREIVENKGHDKVAKNKLTTLKYIRKLVNNKIKARAKKGHSIYRTILKNKYNEFYVVSRLRDMGFKTRINCKNGKAELVIEW